MGVWAALKRFLSTEPVGEWEEAHAGRMIDSAELLSDPQPGLVCEWPMQESPERRSFNDGQRAAFDKALETFLAPHRNTRPYPEVLALEAAFRQGWRARNDWSK